MVSVLYKATDLFFEVIYIALLVRILLSWIPMLQRTSVGNIIYLLTEPILGPIRSVIDKSPLGGGMMLDFSPIFAFFLMDIVKRIVLSLILSLG